MEMIYTHLDAVKGCLSEWVLFWYRFPGYLESGKVRKTFPDATETQLSRRFCVKGMEKGVFQIDDLDMTAEIVHYSVKVETPYIRGHIGPIWTTRYTMPT